MKWKLPVSSHHNELSSLNAKRLILHPDMPLSLLGGGTNFRLGAILVDKDGRKWGITARHVLCHLNEAVIFGYNSKRIATYKASEDESLFEQKYSSHYISRFLLDDDVFSSVSNIYQHTWPTYAVSIPEMLGISVGSVSQADKEIGIIKSNHFKVDVNFESPMKTQSIEDSVLLTPLDPGIVHAKGMTGSLIISTDGDAIGIAIAAVRLAGSVEVVVCPLSRYLEDTGCKLWAPPGRHWSDLDNKAISFKKRIEKDRYPKKYNLRGKIKHREIHGKRKNHTKAPLDYLNLVNVANDLYRNHSDHEFGKKGEIFYCFDSNIADVFYKISLGGYILKSRWINRKRNIYQKNDVDNQVALITAEYLLSGDLPGQKNNQIFMTHWHRVELSNHILKVVNNFKDRAKEESVINEFVEQAKIKIEIARSLKDNVDIGEFRSSSRLIEEDCSVVETSMKNEEEKRRYKKVRKVAELVSKMGDAEQLDQIHRLLTSPLRKNITNISTRFRLSESEEKIFSNEVDAWMIRISEELKRINSRFSLNRERSILSDAKNLALLCIISKKMRRKDQRLVFITTDMAIFNAYRRWWIEEAELDEPFMIRHGSQYSPVYNLGDARSDGDGFDEDVRQIFETIRSLVETILLPFNLMTMEHASSDEFSQSTLRGREDLAMRAFYSTDERARESLVRFVGANYDSWEREFNKQFLKISEQWEEIERIAIGFFGKQIFKRIREDLYYFPDVSDDVESVIGNDSLISYFKTALSTLTEQGNEITNLGASIFLRQSINDIELGVERAPKTIWYELPSGRNVYQVISVDWRNISEMEFERDQQANNDFVKAPEAIFLMASILAMELGQWWRAEEFAENAVKVLGIGGNTSNLKWHELVFLHALTKRYRLGSINLNLGEASDVADLTSTTSHQRHAVALFRDAKKLLNATLNSIHDTDLSDSTKSQYIVRIRSEKTALLLFFATCELSANHFFSNLGSDFTFEKLILRANTQIRKVLQLLSIEQEDNALSRLEPVKAHFFHNCAAIEVLRFLRYPKKFEPDRFLTNLKENEDFISHQSMFEKPITKLESCIFDILHGGGAKHSLDDVIHMVDEVDRSRFIIDKLVARSVREKVEVIERYL